MTDGITNMLGDLPQWCAVVIELLGIAIISIVAVYSLAHGGLRLIKGDSLSDIQQEVRQRLGRGILLGLELLIAADIIHTVAVELTFETVGVLALVVLHLVAIGFYQFVKRDNLVGPMVHGDKSVPDVVPASLDGAPQRLLALVLAALCAGGAYLLHGLGSA